MGIYKICLSIGIFLVSTGLLAQSKAARAEVLYEEALSDYRSRKFEQADDKIDESLYLFQSAKAYYLSGLVHEALGRDLRAVSSYEATLKLDPSFKEAIFQKGLIYLNYGDPGQALKDFNALIGFDGFSETHGLYFQTDPSGETPTQVVSLAKFDARLHHYRGQAYEKLNRYEEAMTDYNEAITREAHADFLLSRALLHAKMEHETQALTDLRSAVALDPGNQLAWYNLAIFDPSAKLPDDLIRESTFAPTLALLASRALEEGDYQSAKRYYDQCLKNDPEDALSYLNRGRVFLKTEQFGLARADFNRSRLLEPDRAEALYLIGNSYFFEKNHELALAYYNQYLTLDPTNAMIWYNGAMAYLEKEDEQNACHYLKKAQAFGMAQSDEMLKKFCN